MHKLFKSCNNCDTTNSLKKISAGDQVINWVKGFLAFYCLLFIYFCSFSQVVDLQSVQMLWLRADVREWKDSLNRVNVELGTQVRC